VRGKEGNERKKESVRAEKRKEVMKVCWKRKEESGSD
jgi:hypothetical protein